MTADAEPQAVPPVDPAVLRTVRRVGIFHMREGYAARQYRGIKESAWVPFAGIRQRGIRNVEITLPDGTAVGLIAIKAGGKRFTVDDAALQCVIALNEPEAFEDVIDPAALRDPAVIALLTEHAPKWVTSKIKRDVLARYDDELKKNNGQVIDRGLGEFVTVATVEPLKPTGEYSVTWYDDGKGQIRLQEAIDAGLITLDGDVVQAEDEAAAPPETGTSEAPAADVPDPAAPASSASVPASQSSAAAAPDGPPESGTPPAAAEPAPALFNAPQDDAGERMTRALSRSSSRRRRGPAHAPTSEQQDILDAVRTGEGVVISAGAGSGKTSSLVMIGDQEAGRHGLYVAFNAAIVADARPRFGTDVQVSTAHALAMAAVGRNYRHRLSAPRVPANQVAKILGINEPLRVAEDRLIAPAQLARLVMETVERFCRSSDPAVSSVHVPRKPGLDTPDALAILQPVLVPLARKAWADLTGVRGQLRYTHDCQPAGTLVRVLTHAGGNNRHDGTSWLTEWRDVPIEQVQVGDRVLTWHNRTRTGKIQRLGMIRKTGREVTKAGDRPYDGRLITVRTASGHQSSYTPEHICVAMVGTAMRGKSVVYMMRKDGHYRVGRVQWAYGSQSQSLGIVVRARAQDPDAMWILSVHDSDTEAALAEAWTQYQYNLPGWQFTSLNEHMPLDQFWAKVGDNSDAAIACLSAYGRDIRYPIWQPAVDGMIRWNQRPIAIRACNLMDGMLACDADSAGVMGKNVHSTGGWTDAWQPLTLSTGWYTGTVYSLEVDDDHTYIGDGIVTHNCYLKQWGLSKPQLAADYILYDECQDADNVVQAVIRAQKNTQLIAVGDKSQQLYEWRGAVNAMDGFPATHKLTLSKSFRFGPHIADEANKWLDILDADLRLTGSEHVPSQLRALETPDAVLCRTNAEVIAQAMRSTADGVATAIVGGGKDVRALAEAAIALKQGRGTSHPELYAFRTWGEVQDHAENDPSGSDLKVLVSLIDAEGPERIIEVVDSLTDEKHAQTVVSTAHKGKGREWDSVRIASDFHPPKGADDDPDGDDVSAPDARLAYVAVTRAKLALDRTGLAWVDKFVPGGAV
jgi:UvrD/REP helicase N-terminal domain